MAKVLSGKTCRAVAAVLTEPLAGEFDFRPWIRREDVDAAREILSQTQRGGAAVVFTRAEINALLNAVGQMTDGNARDFREWRLQTHAHRPEWRALLTGEAKLKAALCR